ncbi:protein kinase domain-containing protein [Cryptosporidium serpentis]
MPNSIKRQTPSYINLKNEQFSKNDLYSRSAPYRNKCNSKFNYERILATKYLSRYKSLDRMLHSPYKMEYSCKAGVSIFIDPSDKRLGASDICNENLCKMKNLRDKLRNIKLALDLKLCHENLESVKSEIEDILKECTNINSNIESIKKHERVLTENLALVKTAFKDSIINYKKIEREINRYQLYFLEAQIGIAPAINVRNKKRKRVVDERPDTEVNRNLSNKPEEIENNNILSTSKMSNDNCRDNHNISESKNTNYNAFSYSMSAIALNGSAEESKLSTSSRIKDCKVEGSPLSSNKNMKIQLDYIDKEHFRDGRKFQNLINQKNLLVLYLQGTERKALASIQYYGHSTLNNNEDEIMQSIVKKRYSYTEKQAHNIASKYDELDIERSLYIKKSRLFRHQQNSRYNTMQTLSPLQPYTLLNMIGKGGFAEVWETLNMNTWKITAAKIHELTPDMTEHERIVCVERVSNEIRLHKDLKHPYIVNMLHCFEVDNDRLVTIMELCDGPDIDSFIKMYGSVSEDLAKIWIRQILEGIMYLNNLSTLNAGETLPLQRDPIIHYDLKPGNIILHKGCCKIADFGLSKVADPISGEAIIERIGGGTVWYQPPEILLRPGDSFDKSRIVTHKVDIWAIGCIFYEILHSRRPFGLGSSSVAEAFTLIPLEATNGPIFSDKISQECKSYIKWLLTCESSERPSIDKAYWHSYIQNLNDNSTINTKSY